MQGQQLALVTIDDEGCCANQLVGRPRQHGGMIQRVDELTMSGDAQRVPVSEESLERRTILRPAWCQLHGSSLASHDLIARACLASLPRRPAACHDSCSRGGLPVPLTCTAGGAGQRGQGGVGRRVTGSALCAGPAPPAVQVKGRARGSRRRLIHRRGTVHNRAPLDDRCRPGRAR